MRLDSNTLCDSHRATRDAIERMLAVHACWARLGVPAVDLRVSTLRLAFALAADANGLTEPGAIRRALTADPAPDPALWDGFSGVMPSLGGEVREAARHAAEAPWDQVSLTLFGTLFQGLADPSSRRQHGAHYTSLRDIHRALDPLFLDALRDQPVERIRSVRVLDPAAGCGDFLVAAYRGLRDAERRALAGSSQPAQVSLAQIAGIELDPLAARVAVATLRLAEHLSNVADRLDRGATAAPDTSPRIIVANALRTDWDHALPHPDGSTFVVGNPPFIGKKEQTSSQKSDSRHVWAGAVGAGVLDYVTGWFRKAVRYLGDSGGAAAFVATSSVAQGEQVGPLWRALRSDGPVHLHFAYTPFPWASDASGQATVHVVVIGFGRQPAAQPVLFEHDPPTRTIVRHLSPYLVDAADTLVMPKSTPLQRSTRSIHYGSFALDDGHYTLSPADRDALLATCPGARRFLRPFVGGEELLTGGQRACLWLEDATEDDLLVLPAVRKRVDAVAAWRRSRTRARTVALANTPALFAERRQPTARYLALPTVSADHRYALPVAFLPAEVVASNQIYVLEHAQDWELGVLASAMHLAWIRRVAGRLGAGLRYSSRIVYNNFPWPEPSASDRAAVEAAAQHMLAVRAGHPDTSLADLYHPARAPAALRDAHRRLDHAVDRCYQAADRPTESARVAMLLERHATLSQPIGQGLSR